MTFPTTNRERALEALRVVLSEIPGVHFVDRQTIQEELLSDAQLPAILIDEGRTDYTWEERHGRRALGARTTVTLDLQCRAPRRTDGPGAAVSTAREIFIGAVIEELANNPELICQLEGDVAPVAHVRDAARTFVADYPPVPHPFARALITLELQLTECPADRRAKTAWQQLIIDLVYPYPGDPEEKRKSFVLEIPSP